VSGKADVIVTGDEDLLVLHPFAGIPILPPAAFLQLLDTAT
jgi:predicted nucleic acid-binding protein